LISFEGFGLPVIEAMYFGRPVILSTLTALPEVGGDAAYYFQNFEPKHMQAVLSESLAHYNANAYMKQKIRDRAAMFNWDKTAAQYLEVYRSLYGIGV
jgi:glycosyltransferase involved in cell wall biosynthesis